MTDVRTNSRDARTELDRHLEEVDDASPIPGRQRQEESDEFRSVRRELAVLREKVAEIRRRMTVIREQGDLTPSSWPEEAHPWLRVGATVLATFVLGKLVQRLRLGAPAAAAVPLIAAQIDRHLWWENEMAQHYGRVIDHVHIRVSNLEASKSFYRSVCEVLGLQDAWKEDDRHCAIDEIYIDTATNYVSKIHLAFQAKSHEEVDAFHRAALAAGGKSNGEPGFRPYHDRYYAAFVFDPDGNNIEAVCDRPTRRSAPSVTSDRV